MAKKFTPKVLTANELLSGDVVYLGPQGQWVGTFQEAQYLDDEATALRVLGDADQHLDYIVGPYLADAVLGPDNTPVPAHFREEFRTTGPSNYNHGKQAEV